MYLYGVGYALASLACTLPVFAIVVGSATVVGDVAGAGAAFIVLITYGLGTGAVLLGVTVSAALFQGAVARWFRRFMPYVRRVSAVLLIVAGLYLIGYMLYYFYGIGRTMDMPMGG